MACSARVVERAREHRHRLHAQRLRDRLHLPVAEVPGEEQHAAALLVGLPHALLAFALDGASIRRGREPRELASARAAGCRNARTSPHAEPPLVLGSRPETRARGCRARSAGGTRPARYASRPRPRPSAAHQPASAASRTSAPTMRTARSSSQCLTAALPRRARAASRHDVGQPGRKSVGRLDGDRHRQVARPPRSQPASRTASFSVVTTRSAPASGPPASAARCRSAAVNQW